MWENLGWKPANLSAAGDRHPTPYIADPIHQQKMVSYTAVQKGLTTTRTTIPMSNNVGISLT